MYLLLGVDRNVDSKVDMCTLCTFSLFTVSSYLCIIIS